MQDFSRYSPQMRFSGLGEPGQCKLAESRALLVGCGGLGSTQATLLVRAGLGGLRIVDRDYVELENLHRQILYDEDDVAGKPEVVATGKPKRHAPGMPEAGAAGKPKAEIAARKLRRINSSVRIEPVVATFEAANAEELSRGVDLILDGTDNIETRFLINDIAVKHGLPWVYGACVGSEGRVLPIIPHQTACLRCIWDQPPPAAEIPTCATAGVLGPVVAMVASFQALAAIKILSGRAQDLDTRMLVIDAWSGRLRQINVQPALDRGDCPCCKRANYEYL